MQNNDTSLVSTAFWNDLHNLLITSQKKIGLFKLDTKSQCSLCPNASVHKWFVEIYWSIMMSSYYGNRSLKHFICFDSRGHPYRWCHHFKDDVCDWMSASIGQVTWYTEGHDALAFLHIYSTLNALPEQSTVFLGYLSQVCVKYCPQAYDFSAIKASKWVLALLENHLSISHNCPSIFNEQDKQVECVCDKCFE